MTEETKQILPPLAWKEPNRVLLIDDLENMSQWIQIDTATEGYIVPLTDHELELPANSSLSFPILKTDLLLHIANGLYEICEDCEEGEGEKEEEEEEAKEKKEKKDERSPPKQLEIFRYAILSPNSLSDFFLFLNIIAKPSGEALILFLHVLFRLKNEKAKKEIDSTNIYAVIAVALYVSLKYWDDHFMNNKSYAEHACHIPVQAFNRLEREMMRILDFTIWPVDDEALYQDLYTRLHNNLYHTT